MERTKAIAINNCALFIVLSGLAFSGIVLENIPRASSDSLESEKIAFFGLERNIWLDVHDVTSNVFLILMAVHIALHKEYIKNLPKMIN